MALIWRDVETFRLAGVFRVLQDSTYNMVMNLLRLDKLKLTKPLNCVFSCQPSAILLWQTMRCCSVDLLHCRACMQPSKLG